MFFLDQQLLYEVQLKTSFITGLVMESFLIFIVIFSALKTTLLQA